MKLLIFIFIFNFYFLSNSFSISLSDAHKDYLNGNHQESIRKARHIRESDDVLYFLGLAHIKIADYAKAQIYLRKLIKNYPASPLQPLAMVRMADTYFLSGNYPEAFELYQEIQKRRPNSSVSSLVLLRLAQISNREGRWRDKDKYLRQIKTKYPKSCEMKFVKILENYDNFFTIQVGAFSNKSNALSLAKILKRKYSPYIIEDKSSVYPIYKVRVGKFSNKYDMKEILSKLIDEGYPVKTYP